VQNPFLFPAGEWGGKESKGKREGGTEIQRMQTQTGRSITDGATPLGASDRQLVGGPHGGRRGGERKRERKNLELRR